MIMLKNYLKIFLKVSTQNKLFTFLSLFGISLTIMFVMIFSMTFNKIVKGSGPEKDLKLMLFADCAKVETSGKNKSINSNFLSQAFCENYLKKVTSAKLNAMYRTDEWTFILNGKHYAREYMLTDADFWKVFDFQFLQGRPYTTEDVVNQNHCAVITQSIKELFFGDEKEVLGKSIRILQLQLTVTGVVEDPSIASQNICNGIFIPYTAMPWTNTQESILGPYTVVFKADSKTQFPAIRKEVQDIITRIDRADDKEVITLTGPRTQFDRTLNRYAFNEDDASPMRNFMKYVLWGLAFIFLPAVNLMALNFARIRERGEEIAVRKSFGAHSGRLRTQFIFENLMLTLTGGVIGVILSFLCITLLGKNLSMPISDFDNVPVSFSFDLKIFIIALISCLIFGLFSGVLPAIRMSKMKPVIYLKGGEK